MLTRHPWQAPLENILRYLPLMPDHLAKEIVMNAQTKTASGRTHHSQGTWNSIGNLALAQLAALASHETAVPHGGIVADPIPDCGAFMRSAA